MSNKLISALAERLRDNVAQGELLRASRDRLALDRLTSYWATPAGCAVPVRRWPAWVCDAAELSQAHPRRPATGDTPITQGGARA